MAQMVSKFETPEGRDWTRRLQRAEVKFRYQSRDWDTLRRLYNGTIEQRREWHVSVPLARTLIDGMVSDTYIQNPDPFIESRMPLPSNLSEQRIRSLFKTLHDVGGTEELVKQGMKAAACMSGVVHWTDYVQDSYETPRPEPEEQQLQPPPAPLQFPAPQATEQPEEESALNVKSQMIRGQLVLGWDTRFDPDGRDHLELKDCKWVARAYSISLADIQSYKAFTPQGKNMVRQWMHGRISNPRSSSLGWGARGYAGGFAYDGSTEKDDNFRMVDCWEIWSRPDKMIYHIPIGSSFHIAAYEWPEEWAEADEFPATPIAFNWLIPDENGIEGSTYAMPDLRLVRSPLENLPRLVASFLDACTNTARKYFTPAGLLNDKTKTAIQTDVNREMLEIDFEDFAKRVNRGQPLDWSTFDMKRFIQLMPQEDSDAMGKQLAAINQQLQLCYLLLGIGPADRGGVPKAESATASMGIQQGLASRKETRETEAGAIFDRISKKFFICLKRQTLPVPYRHSVTMDDSTWSIFSADDLDGIRDMDLVFRHRVGSSRPPTREVIKAERKEILGLAAPALQAMGDNKKLRDLISWVVDAFDSEYATKLLDRGLEDMAMQCALLLDQFRTPNSKVSPANPQDVERLIDTIKQFFNAYLSDPQIQQVAQQSVQATGTEATMPAPTGMGSMAAAPSSTASQGALAAATGAAGGMA